VHYLYLQGNIVSEQSLLTRNPIHRLAKALIADDLRRP